MVAIVSCYTSCDDDSAISAFLPEIVASDPGRVHSAGEVDVHDFVVWRSPDVVGLEIRSCFCYAGVGNDYIGVSTMFGVACIEQGQLRVVGSDIKLVVGK